MKKQWLACLVLPTLAVLASGQPGVPARQRDDPGELVKLQGKWIPTMMYLDNKVLPAWVNPQFTLTLSGQKMFLDINGKILVEVTNCYNAATTPKTLDCFSLPDANGKKRKSIGIYELDRNTLKIAYEATTEDRRPRDFKIPGKRSRRVIMFLRRAEVKEKKKQ